MLQTLSRDSVHSVTGAVAALARVSKSRTVLKTGLRKRRSRLQSKPTRAVRVVSTQLVQLKVKTLASNGCRSNLALTREMDAMIASSRFSGGTTALARQWNVDPHVVRRTACSVALAQMRAESVSVEKPPISHPTRVSKSDLKSA